MQKWLFLVGAEVVIIATSFGVNPEWAAENWMLLLAIGVLLLIAGLAIGDRSLRSVFGEAGPNPRASKVDAVVAGRIYRDMLDKHELRDWAEQHDYWGSETVTEREHAYTEFFLAVVEIYAEELGLPKIKGRPENGSAKVKIPMPFQDDVGAYQNRQKLMLTGSDGRGYTDLEFERESIEQFVLALKKL